MNKALALALPALLLVAAAPIPQDPGDTLTVILKETRLRAGKRVFSPAVAELHEGDKVGFVSKQGAWLNVKYAALAGWLHETDVTARTDVRLSGEGVRENYSAAEAGAARKGFNPQVEREYRATNPELAAAFAILDRIQARATSEAEVKEFLQAGGLWRESER